jgi:tetratricopeptide (TPR) repeat protein
MKRFYLVCILTLSALALLVRADGPDDQYIQIYKLIQDGDQMNKSSQTQLARKKYVEALTGLKKLQTSFPNWNENVIRFRLNYVAEKLGSPTIEKAVSVPLEKPLPPLQRPSAVTSQQIPDDKEERIVALTQEIRRLESANAALGSKLQEALSAQPASIDPRELAKAEGKVKLLEKEKELLKVTLEQEQTKLASRPDSTAVDELKKALTEATKKLSQQTEIAQALAREKEILEARLEGVRRENDTVKILRVENETLKKQLSESRLVPGPTQPTDKPSGPLASTVPQTNMAMVAELRASLSSLQEEKNALERSKAELETKLAKATSPATKPNTSESDRVKQVENERDELLRKLNETTKQLYDNKARMEQVQRGPSENQLTNLQARLEVLEARKVPYTSEELALFKQPPLVSAKADPRVGKKSPKEWPKGAEPLLAEAERAFAARRFDEAEKKYVQVLLLDDKNVFTLANLAASQLEQNRLVEAESNLNRALAKEPTDADSLSLLGILKFRQNKFDEALDVLSRAALLDPQNPQTQNYLGIALSEKGQRSPAEAALRRAIQLLPGYGSAHNNLAVIYAAQQPPFTELARWHYQKALASGHPQNPELEKMIEGNRSPSGTKQ